MVQRLWRNADGSAAIEFGLVLPLLLVVLVGIIDYGQIHFTRLTMTNAAREGARVGVTMSEDDAQAAAVATTSSYLDRAGVDAVVTATVPSQSTPTVTVTVTIDRYEPLIGLVPTPGRLGVSASMRWELANP
jgi:Flp pilus assembly protein TadG